MGIAYLVVAVLSAAAAVFALQNGQPMPLRFLVWSMEGVPLAGAILVALAAGVVLAGVPLSIDRWRWRARARSLETQVTMLERAMGERDVPLLALRPARPVREA